MNAISPPSTKRRAFTLLELLLVVGVVSVLLGLVAPTVHEALKASQLKDAANIIYNRITEARQLAMSLGTQTEVRFYRSTHRSGVSKRPLLHKVQVLALLIAAGEEDASSGEPVFQPTSSPESWKENIVISDDPDQSSICKLTYRFEETPAGNQRFIAFRFHPDGSTTLPVGESWFLTVMDERHVFNGPLPKNFITLQIDPATGRVRSFQPE